MDDASPVVPASTPLDAWLSELAQRGGAPGGGAAAGVMLGLSAGLLGMVAEYSTADPRASAVATRLSAARRAALEAAETDGVASAEFGAALALPSDDPQRDGRVVDASMDAARTSLALGRVAQRVLAELAQLADISASSMDADLAVAAQALAAGMSGASINLRANLQTARKHGGEADAELEEGRRALALAQASASGLAARLADAVGP